MARTWGLFYTTSSLLGVWERDSPYGDKGLLPVQKSWQEESVGIASKRVLSYCSFSYAICSFQEIFLISTSGLCFLCLLFFTPFPNKGERDGQIGGVTETSLVLESWWGSELVNTITQTCVTKDTTGKKGNILHSDVLQSHGKILNSKI